MWEISQNSRLQKKSNVGQRRNEQLHKHMKTKRDFLDTGYLWKISLVS